MSGAEASKVALSVAPAVIAAATALAHGDRRRLLGIVGAPASGKSTLAECLAARLGPKTANVPMDGFHLSQRVLAHLGRASRKGAPDTFDAAGYRALLHRIKHGYGGDEIIYAPDFDRDLEEPIAGRIPIDPDVALAITEGNYLLLDETSWAPVAPQLDEIWFLHVDTARREHWLAARHQRFGRSEADAWTWIAATDRPNAARIEACASRADRHLVWDGPALRFAGPGDV